MTVIILKEGVRQQLTEKKDRKRNKNEYPFSPTLSTNTDLIARLEHMKRLKYYGAPIDLKKANL